MVDAAPCHVGHMQKTINAAEVNERTVIGDVLDDAFNDLTLFEVLDDLGALFSTALLQERYGAIQRCCRGACPS